jgi:predicted aldo/keto reductase-like oxidoreductase
MQHRSFGNTGIKVSILGFGAMRLPEKKINDKYYVKEEQSVKIIHRAFDLGVNYIDTAYDYCHGQSELIVGKAIKGWRDRVYLSTKMPTWMVKKTGDYFRFLEEQLKKLGVDYIDFYHFHALDKDCFENIVLKYNLLDQALKAKDKGIIGHISFSFHDEPRVMKKIIDTGVFESVLCQYNLLDRVNSEAISYAREKGLGVAVMGPVGGGRITALDFILDSLEEKVGSLPQLALKFVFSNKDVSVALSGMENMKMVSENTRIASQPYRFTDDENRILENLLSDDKIKRLIGCTNCRYCMPCSSNVAIPDIIKTMNYYMITENKDNAILQYRRISSNDIGELADACTECGECEEKCPQQIKVIDKLKEIHRTLG